MDEVALLLGQYRNELLVMRHHGLEFVLGAAADVEEQRNEADAFGQQPADFLGHAWAHGRIDHADDAAPTGTRHELNLSVELFSRTLRCGSAIGRERAGSDLPL